MLLSSSLVCFRVCSVCCTISIKNSTTTVCSDITACFTSSILTQNTDGRCLFWSQCYSSLLRQTHSNGGNHVQTAATKLIQPYTVIALLIIKLFPFSGGFLSCLLIKCKICVASEERCVASKDPTDACIDRLQWRLYAVD